MKKNGKIEVLRFLFCMCIIFFHCGRLLKIPFHAGIGSFEINFFSRGYIGVEFFFLVSGYFMAADIYKKEISDRPYDMGKETLAFMKHKIWGVFPYHIAAFAILFFITGFARSWSGAVFVRKFFESIPGMLFLQKFGFNYFNLNRVEWYLSAMFIIMAVLYPLCRKYYSMFVRVIAPFGGLYLSGMLIAKYGTMTGASRWVEGYGFACVLRAAAMISLGASTFEISRYLREKEFTAGMKRILTVFESAGYVFAVLFSVSELPKYFEIQCVLALIGSLSLTFSGQTCGFRIFNRKWAYFLGGASLQLYLNQLAAINIVHGAARTAHIGIQLVFVLLLASIFSVITYMAGKCLDTLPEKLHW